MRDYEPPLYWAVVPAAGKGERMRSECPKQYLTLAGATVLEHALRPFLNHPRFSGIVVVVAEDDERWEQIRYARHPAIVRATGGAHRANSVMAGLQALSGRAKGDDWVLVHDAARPCLARADLDHLIATLQNEPVGGLLATPLHDTVKRADAEGLFVAETVERRGLWRAQTPQMFRYGLLCEALRDAIAAGSIVTDESAALEARGLAPRIVEGSPFNIKVTRPEDLILADAILAKRTQ